MKVSSGEIDGYLYERIVAPLKGVLISDDGETPTNDALTKLMGRPSDMAIERVNAPRRGRHNYERDRYNQIADSWVVLYWRGGRLNLGRYDKQHKHLRLYTEAFKTANILPLMHKLKHVFERSSIKQRVTIITEEHNDPRTTQMETQVNAPA